MISTSGLQIFKLSATKREGGHVKFYPYKKGEGEKVLAILKGGHKTFWGRFYVVA